MNSKEMRALKSRKIVIHSIGMFGWKSINHFENWSQRNFNRTNEEFKLHAHKSTIEAKSEFFCISISRNAYLNSARFGINFIRRFIYKRIYFERKKTRLNWKSVLIIIEIGKSRMKKRHLSP